MGSKVHVSVAWGVEKLFGVKGHVAEEHWSAMDVATQQQFIKDVLTVAEPAKSGVVENQLVEPTAITPEQEAALQEIVDTNQKLGLYDATQTEVQQ